MEYKIVKPKALPVPERVRAETQWRRGNGEPGCGAVHRCLVARRGLTGRGRANELKNRTCGVGQAFGDHRTAAQLRRSLSGATRRQRYSQVLTTLDSGSPPKVAALHSALAVAVSVFH